jgi:vacuolar-type H+-ATPase subunit I/STV1
MKYLTYWLRKEVSKVYDKLSLRNKQRHEAEIETENYVNENRKRIQDLELVTKDIAKTIDRMKGTY